MSELLHVGFLRQGAEGAAFLSSATEDEGSSDEVNNRAESLVLSVN
jgi:hypothetical protein